MENFNKAISQTPPSQPSILCARTAMLAIALAFTALVSIGLPLMIR